ncbi:hypothetical protein M5K25_027439 [Dendrobium thyrsiflorum]|uniref:Protein FAR1-RELATED SEQUENCE n=1 Tax=Dendrobium thyrsiflorum TaxID=117978 RepID=A0ABD0U0B8_DENTH
MVSGSLMEPPLDVSAEIDRVKEVEMNGMVVLHNGEPQDMLTDSSKTDEIKEIISDGDKVPNVGMTFKTYDEVSNFYKQYALRVGFGVIVKKSWFSKSGKCRRVLLGCSRAGSGRADACYQARLTAKTNCQAMIGVRRRDDGFLHIVEANLEHNHPVPLIASKFYMEEQLSKMYTLNMFKKFQEELKATMYCHASPIKIDGPIHIFEIKECSYMENGKRTESKDHEVCYNSEELAVHCVCGFFQFNGILCRHSLTVFKLQQVFEIPSPYVLDRWKKDFKRLYRLARYSDDIIPNSPMERYEYLSVRLLQLVELGFVSEERYQLALKLIRELEKSLLDDPEGRDRQPRLLSFETQTSQCVNDLLSSQFAMSKNSKNPPSFPAKRRGRPPKKIKQSNLEILVQTNKEQDFLRPSLIGSENLVFQAASTSSPLDVHVGSQGCIDLMEDVNSNELSFSTHFGVHANPQHHLGAQTLYEQQALENPARVQWLYPQNYQVIA